MQGRHGIQVVFLGLNSAKRKLAHITTAEHNLFCGFLRFSRFLMLALLLIYFFSMTCSVTYSEQKESNN